MDFSRHSLVIYFVKRNLIVFVWCWHDICYIRSFSYKSDNFFSESIISRCFLLLRLLFPLFFNSVTCWWRSILFYFSLNNFIRKGLSWLLQELTCLLWTISQPIKTQVILVWRWNPSLFLLHLFSKTRILLFIWSSEWYLLLEHFIRWRPVKVESKCWLAHRWFNHILHGKRWSVVSEIDLGHLKAALSFI